MEKKPKRIIYGIIILIFLVNAALFLYTFLQPRYQATITSVSHATTVMSSSRSYRHRQSYHVASVTVTYTDRNGAELQAQASYSHPTIHPVVGQKIVIVKNFSGEFILYPYRGIRRLCGVLALMTGMFLLFEGVELYSARRWPKT